MNFKVHFHCLHVQMWRMKMKLQKQKSSLIFMEFSGFCEANSLYRIPCIVHKSSASVLLLFNFVCQFNLFSFFSPFSKILSDHKISSTQSPNDTKEIHLSATIFCIFQQMLLVKPLINCTTSLSFLLLSIQVFTSFHRHEHSMEVGRRKLLFMEFCAEMGL
jgi:hypothetical protein